jgi:3-phenylpropionate/trans-cinnamate dioxygenase ferredoxin reductase subunit
MPDRVVIVGAGLAGSRCALTLRAEGFEGEVVLIGEEPHPPYERPALSKAFLGGTREELALPADWGASDIRLVLDTRVEQVDPDRERVRTAGGDHPWDALVLATGARPRSLPDVDGQGVHVLRTRADAERLRAELVPGRRLAVVGAGFVGTEVASTALELGLQVALVDVERLPFERVLGTEVARILATRYRRHGVDLKLGARVGRLRRDTAGRLRALILADGTELPCDVVLVAVGVAPAGELLHLPAGIPTDPAGRTSLRGVYACGDVAAPWHPAVGGHHRLEHWTSAADQAGTVARAILGREPRGAPCPYFWSDQFGVRIQHMGVPTGWTRVVVEDDGDSLEARYLADGDRLVAALLLNRPRAAAELRRRLAAEALAA